MANRRMISKSISVSKQVNDMSLLSRLIFTWMIPHADDWGRMAGDPGVIRAMVFPMSTVANMIPGQPIQITITDEIIDGCLDEMVDSALIVRYETDGIQYLCFPSWDNHQTGLHKRTPSKFPEVPGSSGKFRDLPASCARGTEQNRREGNRTEGNCAFDASVEDPTPGDAHSSPLFSFPITKAYIDVFLPGGTIPNKERRKAFAAVLQLSKHPLYESELAEYSQGKRALEWLLDNREDLGRNGDRKPLQYIVPALLEILDNAMPEDAG
jgi:hypothetical protein